jgi:hypothetical protein
MINKPGAIAQSDIKIRILIAGFPGIGKSTLGLSAPRPLHIDVDRGVSRVMAAHRKDYIQPETYDELLNDLVTATVADYDTLVIDTGGKLLDLMKPWAIKSNSAYGQKDGSLSLKGYGAVGKEFNRLMDYCYYTLKKHVVVLFHAKEEKDGDTTKLRILVEGQTKDNVWQPMELGGFMEVVGKARTIGFSNCERYFAKGTHGIKDIITLPDVMGGQPNDFLAKLFETVNANIRAEATVFEQAKAQYEAVIAEYRPQIDSLTGETLMTVGNALKGANHVLTSKEELQALLKAKIKDIGYVWDKEAKTYVKAEQATDNSVAAE